MADHDRACERLSEPLLSAAEPLPSPRLSTVVVVGKAVNKFKGCNRNFNDIVQFTCPAFFAKEEDRRATVSVMRLGNLSGIVKVKYYTEDLSAKAFARYIPVSREEPGEIVFQDGEHDKAITIDLVDDDLWSTTLEFKLHLFSNEGCDLGDHLNSCRVKIIDNDKFPSGKFGDRVDDEEEIETIRGPLLFLEYFKLILHGERVKFLVAVICLCSQLENLYLYFTLYMNVYIVDVLFNPEESGNLWLSNSQETAILIGLLFILPQAGLLLWEKVKEELDLGGRVKDIVRTNLFRKYLNYSEHSRLKVPASVMHVAIMQDVDEVAAGYMAVLEVLQVGGKLTILSYFILMENSRAFWAVVMMPTMTCIWIWYRSKPLVEAAEDVAAEEARVTELVHEATQRYRLIADYGERHRIVQKFHKTNNDLRRATVKSNVVMLYSNYFPKFLGPLFIGVYLMLHASDVMPDGDARGNRAVISIGTFMATIKIFQELAEEFAEGYEALVEVTGSIGPLRKLTLFFNLKTDEERNMNVDQKRLERSKEERNRHIHMENSKAQHDQTDSIPLMIEGMSYGFQTKTGVTLGEKILFKNADVQAPQGKLVAIVGVHGSGKSTLLRLLSHTRFPEERNGGIFVPTHLRCLHVSQEPVLLREEIMENLTFGHPEVPPAGKLYEKRNARCLQILRELRAFKCYEQFKSEADERKEQFSQRSATSDMDGSWLHLARTRKLQKTRSNLSALEAGGGTGIQSFGKTESKPLNSFVKAGTWHIDQSFQCVASLSEEKLKQRATLIDRTSCESVAFAVDGLNNGSIKCDECFCVVFSSRRTGYFVIYTNNEGSLEAAMTALDGTEEDAVDEIEAPILDLMVPRMKALSEVAEEQEEEEEEEQETGTVQGEEEGEGGGAETEYVMEFCEEATRWQDALAYTDKAKIHLSRALVVNPEVLVLQRPFMHYSEATSRIVMRVLKEHVTHKGAACYPHDVASLSRGERRELQHEFFKRRPRTVFFTPSTREQAGKADVIWKIDEKSGTIEMVEASRVEDLDPDLF